LVISIKHLTFVQYKIREDQGCSANKKDVGTHLSK